MDPRGKPRGVRSRVAAGARLEPQGTPILISCTNGTARNRIALRLPGRARVRLAPLDLIPFVAHALRRERPSCIVFVETEIWPGWLRVARAMRIPVAFVSARDQ